MMHQGPHLLAPTGSDLSGANRKAGTVLAGWHNDLNLLTIHGKSRCTGPDAPSPTPSPYRSSSAPLGTSPRQRPQLAPPPLCRRGRRRYPGLFVWLKDGTKMAVKVPPGCLLVQAAQQLEHLTCAPCPGSGDSTARLSPLRAARAQPPLHTTTSPPSPRSTRLDRRHTHHTHPPPAPFASPSAAQGRRGACRHARGRRAAVDHCGRRGRRGQRAAGVARLVDPLRPHRLVAGAHTHARTHARSHARACACCARFCARACTACHTPPPDALPPPLHEPSYASPPPLSHLLLRPPFLLVAADSEAARPLRNAGERGGLRADHRR